MAKPEIRLKGFNGVWRKRKIGELADILTGYPFEGSSIKKEGKILLMRGINITEGYIRHSDDIDRYYDGDVNSLNKYIVRTNDLVIGMDGSKVGKNSALVTERENGSLLVQRVARLRNDDIDVNRIIQIALRSSRFIQYVEENKTSSAIPHISPSDIFNFELTVSDNKDERKAIANYFGSLDSMIQATMKKIASLKQMKSASLVSMFPQAGETKPRVRFKGYNGDWEKIKLSSIAKRITRKNSQLESTLPLTISAAEGLIEQTAFFNNIVASSNVSGYYLVKNGEFAYNKSYSNGYPWGAVKRLDKYDMGVLSTLYIVFSIDDSVSSDYIVHFFDTTLWHQEVAIRAAEGARNHGLLNIGAEDFLDIDIVLPEDKKEQQRIASYFKSLDKQISLQEQRLEKLKQIKAACLDKMFV